MATTKGKDYDYIFKIVLVGDTCVGKSCILVRFSDDVFVENYVTTIGVDFRFKTMVVNGKIAKIQIWDTAGQERYRSITSVYYKGAQGCLLVYDITKKPTFENIDRWISDLKNSGDENLSIILIGNKCDLENERKVTKEEAKEKAQFYKLAFIETSALNGTNIEKAFELLLNDIYIKYSQIPKKQKNLLMNTNTVDISEEKKEKKGGCCG